MRTWYVSSSKLMCFNSQWWHRSMSWHSQQKRAIALSLEESNSLSKPVSGIPLVVNLLSDHEEEEDNSHSSSVPDRRYHSVQENLGKKQSSLLSHGKPSKTGRVPEEASSVGESSATKDTQTNPEPTLNFLFGGLDRQKMERERLARIAERKKNQESIDTVQPSTKRKASISAAHESANKKQVVDQLSGFPVSLSGRPLPVQKVISDISKKGSGVSSRTSSKAGLPILPLHEQDKTMPLLGVHYPDGIVKNTVGVPCLRSYSLSPENANTTS